MTRSAMWATTGVALVLALGPGCDRTSDEQKAAKEVITKAFNAQMETDKKGAAAEGDLGPRRDDYVSNIRKNVADLDEKIERLEWKYRVASGNAKTDLDAILEQIRARRAAFNATIAATETAAAVQWDSTKARVEKEWADLKAMVDKTE